MIRMSPELFQKVEELYQAVLDRSPQERAQLLQMAEPEVRAEVESLLSNAHSGPRAPVARCDPTCARCHARAVPDRGTARHGRNGSGVSCHRYPAGTRGRHQIAAGAVR